MREVRHFWMHLKQAGRWSIWFLAPIILLSLGLAARVEAASVTYNSSGTWTAPAGVTTIMVEAWGGGGGGGSQNGKGAAGGGAGAYAWGYVTVVPGNTYNVTVGAGGGSASNGGDSYFAAGASVMAGAGLAGSGNVGGVGGTVLAGTGFSGCAGGNSTANIDHGGGGGGSPTAAGSCTAGQNATSGAPGNGGTGEASGGTGGVSGMVGGSGNVPGAGAGGGGKRAAGGTGGAGRVVITYPSVSIGNASANEGNSGTSTLSIPVTVTHPSPTLSITLSYTLSGGTATGGTACVAGVDYINTATTVTIPANTASGAIPVTICGDSTAEPNETFTVTLTAATNAAIETGTATGTILNDDAAVSSFNAFETSTAAGAISGVIKTKIAGSAFSLDVVAISNGAQSAGFNGTVKVELLGNTTTGISLDANNCPTSFTLLQTVSPNPTISGGRSTVSFAAVSNAWKDVRVRISYPTSSPTVTSCSNDNFAIRPDTLGAYAAHADWETAGTTETLNNAAASGTPIHKAGRNFTLVATGYNALSNVTGNYDGTPAALNVAAVAPATVVGNFAVGTFIAPSPVTGTVRSDTATYDEVGPVSLILQDQNFASVDAADTAGDCTATGRYVCSATFNVGRFVPDHFIVTTGTLTNRRLLGCSPASAFTYAGEQLRVGFTLAARNGLATPTVTQNYTTASGLAKLDGTVIANFGFGAIDLADVTPPTNATALTGNLGLVASSGSWVAGAGSFTADLGLNRAATPDGPYESFRLGIVPTDTDGVTVRTSDLNLDTTVPADSNDRVLVGSSIVRFGRLRLSNAHGSELLNLPIPISVQYWNGTLFTTHTADSCTSLTSANIGLDNYKNNLASGETSVSPATINFASGIGTMRLTAPGAGNSGSVDLCVDLGADPAGGVTCSAAASAGKSYLQGKWAPGTTWDNDPKIRATFGVYKNANEFIYLREMY